MTDTLTDLRAKLRAALTASGDRLHADIGAILDWAEPFLAECAAEIQRLTEALWTEKLRADAFLSGREMLKAEVSELKVALATAARERDALKEALSEKGEAVHALAVAVHARHAAEAQVATLTARVQELEGALEEYSETGGTKAEAFARGEATGRAAALTLAERAIDAESELPGEPSTAMLTALMSRPVEVMRAAVVATKTGIRLRLKALAQADAPAPTKE